MVQPTLQKMSLKEAYESFSSNNKGPVHEDRRLQIEELDEWRTHKPRTPGKSKLRQNEPDTSSNQLKVGDKVLLNAADPHIITTTPIEEIPLTVLSISPLGTVEVSHPKFGTFKGKRFLQHGLRLNAAIVLYGHGRPWHARVDEPWGLHTRAWEKRTKLDIAVRHGRGRVPWPCAPRSRNTLYYSLSSPFKNPNPSRCNSTRTPCHTRTECRLQEERKPSYLLQRRGREHPLPQVQPQKFVTLSCSSPEGPKKRFFKYFGLDP
ncbi:hypothetical protein GOBAR_AA18573 [Gossypium barbadense]|uniref:Uncharacterized protein n=1 Tax=Gossypium barbadense TaxID=3634 RepID=A0A2P5XFI8_GOSBA|nr:hypothetical protein GOBAR_AA18573 [Gossypium barbadense]